MNQRRLDDLDVRLRRAIEDDPRIKFALAYGSRTQSPDGRRQDDEYSDLEYYVYLHPGTELGAHDFVLQVTPVLLAVVHPFGTPNFVTPKLHRIEFHVETADRLPNLLGWSVCRPDIARMLIKDSGDELADLLARFAAQKNWRPEPPQLTLDRILNALVAVRGFLLRGERLRAYEWQALWVVGGLTRLARHAEEAVQPPAPGRWAELDLSGDLLGRLNSCAPTVSELECGWQHALNLCTELADRLELEKRPTLVAALRAFSPGAPPSGD